MYIPAPQRLVSGLKGGGGRRRSLNGGGRRGSVDAAEAGGSPRRKGLGPEGWLEVINIYM